MASSNRKRFGLVLRDLLLETEHVSAAGNVQLASFVRELPNVEYETLRKAVTGDRPPSLELMEAVAKALGVEPWVFYEYGLELSRLAFDVRAVGLDKALDNVEAWLKTGGADLVLEARTKTPRRRPVKTPERA